VWRKILGPYRITISLIYRESLHCVMRLAEDTIVSQPPSSPTEHVPSIENRLRVRGRDSIFASMLEMCRRFKSPGC
jgi:hypothetical protein